MDELVRMVAGAAQTFGGRRLRVGDTFDVGEAVAADLQACGLASRAEDDRERIVGAECVAQADAMAAIEPRGKRGPDKKPRKKRQYKRRDMEAE